MQLRALIIFSFKKAIKSGLPMAMILLFIPALLASHLFDVQNIGFQIKFVKDVGLTLLSLLSLVIAVFLAFDQIFWVKDSKTPYFILGRIKSRSIFTFGTFLGMALSLFATVLSASVFMIFFLKSTRGIWFWEIFSYGILVSLKFSLLIAILVLCATVFTRLMTFSATIILFFTGHYLDFIRYKIDTINSQFATSCFEMLGVFIPDFSLFHTYFVSQSRIVFLEVVFYAFLMSSFYLFVAAQILKRKDF